MQNIKLVFVLCLFSFRALSLYAQSDPPPRAGFTWIKDASAAGGHWERVRAATGTDTKTPATTQSPRQSPNSSESEIGYSPLIVDAPGMEASAFTALVGLLAADKLEAITISGDNIDVNRLQPQHRSVGEKSVLSRPMKSYEVLEGIVLPSECHVSIIDFPTSHYTHDFTFRVKPDPEYSFLLSNNNTLRDSKTGKFEQQTDIEIEWESGLGADENSRNPAVPSNVKGNSFGFYSKGHKRKDVIWNWATPGDRVYIEGLWIWERGHLPSHTEIHPPHFVAVQRHLPVSFTLAGNSVQMNNLPNDQFYGTRIDVYADADGSTMWNKKGLQPFAQIVDMNRKDYTFTVKNIFTKPQNSTAQLACKVIKRPGDDFPAEPVITLLPNGEAEITIPWKTKNVSNLQTFARTFILYWDVPSTKGILVPKEKPNLHKIQLEKIQVLVDDDPHKVIDNDNGEWFLYANVGSDWYMMNEFATSAADALSGGLHDAKEGQQYPLNITTSVYITPMDTYRVFSDGWEGDHMNTRMGIVNDEYDRSVNRAKPFLANIFNTEGFINGEYLDDDLGEVSSIYRISSPLGANAKKSSDGNYKLFWNVLEVTN